jgi:hypothetical protein
VADATISPHYLKGRPALFAFISAIAIIAPLCLVLDPLWETNDDIAMSMVAHGYGLAAYGSPHLIFSNVLWGYCVRALPDINGMPGYSLGTLAVLLVVGTATLYFLLRLGVGYLVGVLTIALLLARPTLFPQFTINAGLLGVAAVIGWQVHARLDSPGSFFVPYLLAFFAFLIRSQELFLVLGVALPFLPWRALQERRQAQIAFLLLGLAIVSSAAFDRWAYRGSEWQRFQELNAARAPYTDFGAGAHLKQRPEIMARHGYSQNDIDLVADWFFVDPKIADPNALNAMLTELGPLPLLKGSVESGWKAIRTLLDPNLLPLLLSAILLLVILPRWSVALAWVLLMAALFAMGTLGRPGVLRVYVPLLSLLLVAPLAVGPMKQGFQRWMATLALLVASVCNAYQILPQALASKQRIQEAQRGILNIPVGPIVSWGVGLPIESIFPLMAKDPHFRGLRIYPLGVFTHAPFSVATAEEKAGRGMIDRLRSVAGVSIIASQHNLDQLHLWCREHLNGQFREIVAQRAPSVTVRQVWCEVGR